MQNDSEPHPHLDRKVEERRELAQLLTQSMSGRENEINGKVAEAVNYLDDCDGIKAWSENLRSESKAKTKKWYQRARFWIKGSIICMLALVLFTIIWCLMNISFTSRAALYTPSIGSMTRIQQVALQQQSKTINTADHWLVNNNTFHPLTGSYPFDRPLDEKFLKQNAAEYVVQNETHYMSPGNGEELLEIGAKIDPDNPWYLYQRVAHLAENAGLESAKSRKSMSTTSGITYDEAMVREAWLLLEKADKMGKYVQHRDFLQIRKQSIMSSAVSHDYLGIITYIGYVSGYSMPDTLHHLNVHNVFATKFESLELNGTKAEVKKWLNIYQNYISAILDAQKSIVGTLVVNSNLMNYETMIEGALKRVELSDDLSKAQILTKQLKEDKIKSEELAEKWNSVQPKRSECSLLYTISFGNKLPMGPLANSHIYNRNAEHAATLKILSIVIAFLLFLLFLDLLTYNLIRGKVSRFLGVKISEMLGFKDWLFILIGFSLPIILYYLCNHSNWLDARRWAINGDNGLLSLYQFISLFILQLTLCYCIIRWRLSVCSKGVVKKVNKPVWMTLRASLAVMLLSGLIVKDGIAMDWIGYLCSGFIGFIFISILYRSLRGYRKQEDVIAIAGINHCMTLIVCLAIISSILMAPYYYAEEKKWVQLDPELTFNPEILGMTTQENESAINLKKQLQERIQIFR